MRLCSAGLGLVLLALLGACSGSMTQAGTRLEPAAIESLELRISDTAPPMYSVEVIALAGGCLHFAEYRLERRGTNIDVTVLNRHNGGQACTLDARYYDLTVHLGSDFLAGTEYTITVNGHSTTLIAN